LGRKSGSSSHWRAQQSKDAYVEEATRRGLRSRAWFKLEQIDRKERFIERGQICIDLGAAPGGWSQYAAKEVGASGAVWAVDLLPMDPLERVSFVKGDFTDEAVRAGLLDSLAGRRPDLVMSDMAPNISGNRAIDQPRSIALAEEALFFCDEVLCEGGSFLVKLFQGEGFDEFTRLARQRFRRVKLLKPRASRPESREMYLLARNFGM
jgi:23S rRNA (uridine2552-2'-O)-methyltransferase